MAIYRLQASIVSRSRGQSVIACAAYRAGEKLYDERHGEVYDFTRKQDVAFTEILLPEGAPEWMRDRQKLWNAVEANEKRKDSQLAREIQLALPRELTLSQNIDLLRDFIKSRFVSLGMVADVAIHMPKASDGGLQPHAHILLTMRAIVGNIFGLKMREWNEKCGLEMWRAEWCDYQNKHLALNGHDVRVDHRSLKEQGIDLIPQKKIGPTGFFHRMAAYEQHLENSRTNGERLLANPEMVLDVLTHQQSTFTHRDIARIINRYTADGEQFLAVYEKVKVSQSLVALGRDNKGLERFTTKEMVQLESEMMGNAQSLNVRNDHAVEESLVSPARDKHQLSNEQAAVLKHVVSTGDLKNVVGFAGTGKSRLLGAAREVWEQSGYRILGATLSGIAAENLEGSSGIESRTLASRIFAWEQGRESLTSKDILVIDEAGMIGTRQMAEIMDEASKRSAKIVLVGDPEQLQAIEAGAAFRGVIEKYGHVELTEIWRQKIAWQREATVQFATGKTADAIAQYATNDSVHAFGTNAEAMRALVSNWNDTRVSQPDRKQIMLAYTRDEVLELNRIARGFCVETGDLTNERSIETSRGERLFSEGERIYFLKNDRDLGVKNGTLGTILQIDDNSLTVKLDKEDKENNNTICFSAARYNHLDYGYATTIYKAQSVTVDQSSILPSRFMDAHSAYVMMTRHREVAEIYWGKDEFKDYDNMVNVLSGERDKDLVQDYISYEFEKASFAMHRGLDTLWDTFWEKYGREWLERIQHRLSVWMGGAKEVIESVKEQVVKLGTKEVWQEANFDKGGNDTWLDKMRAIRDEAYKNNPELEKELRLARYNSVALQEATEVNRDTGSNLSIAADNPITVDKRAYYEQRYQEIMKEAEKVKAKKEISDLQSEQTQTEKSIQNVDKEIEMDF